MRRAAVTAYTSVRAPVPLVEQSGPDWHTLSYGLDARVSMDTRTLQETYLAMRAHLLAIGELPGTLEGEAEELARRTLELGTRID